MVNLRIDFHAHIADHYDLAWNNSIPIIGGKNYDGFMNNKGYNPKNILNRSLEFEDHTLLGVINFEDRRAEGVLSGIERLSDQFDIPTAREGSILTVLQDKKVASFWAGREYRTKQGDVLVLGMTHDIKSDDIEQVVGSASQLDNTLVLIPHVGKYGPIGANQKAIERVREYIHGVDSREVAKNLGLPFYSASDSHTLDGTFSSHMILPTCEIYTSNTAETIKRKLMKGQMISLQGKPNVLENLRHASSVILAVAGLKSGMIKRVNRTNI